MSRGSSSRARKTVQETTKRTKVIPRNYLILVRQYRPEEAVKFARRFSTTRRLTENLIESNNLSRCDNYMSVSIIKCESLTLRRLICKLKQKGSLRGFNLKHFGVCTLT